MRLFACLLLVGCAHSAMPPKTAPDTTVRAEIQRAEDAELHRQHDVARTHYQAAVAAAHDPASIDLAHREFAETLATWGELDESRTHYEAAITARSDDPIAWHDLGLVRNKLGDVHGAFTALERAKQLAPRAYPPRRDLAVLHWTLGEGRTADPDPQVAARHRAAALAEYKDMLDLDLPDRVREKVRWAIGILSKPPAAPPPAS